MPKRSSSRSSSKFKSLRKSLSFISLQSNDSHSSVGSGIALENTSAREGSVRENTAHVSRERVGGDVEESTIQDGSTEVEGAARPGSDYRSLPSTPSWAPPGWYEDVFNQSPPYPMSSLTEDPDDDEERFTFEEYINMIRDQSNENLSGEKTFSGWGISTSTCTSTTNSTTNSTASSKGGRSSVSPTSLEGDEAQDPVEKRILVKQQMTEEVRESELDSKERLEVNDKIESDLPPSNVIRGKKRRGRRKMRKKSFETLTLLGNSVCALCS
ncbi:hypothetical protein ACHWQZ_G001646 [Mnemiopsis leidyi]